MTSANPNPRPEPMVPEENSGQVEIPIETGAGRGPDEEGLTNLNQALQTVWESEPNDSRRLVLGIIKQAIVDCAYWAQLGLIKGWHSTQLAKMGHLDYRLGCRGMAPRTYQQVEQLLAFFYPGQGLDALLDSSAIDGITGAGIRRLLFGSEEPPVGSRSWTLWQRIRELNQYEL